MVSPASESLFDYTAGTNYDHFYDPDWIPQWTAPTNVPPGFDSNNIKVMPLRPWARSYILQVASDSGRSFDVIFQNET